MTNGVNNRSGAAGTSHAKAGTGVIGAAIRRRGGARFRLDERREAAGVGNQQRQHSQEQPMSHWLRLYHSPGRNPNASPTPQEDHQRDELRPFQLITCWSEVPIARL